MSFSNVAGQRKASISRRNFEPACIKLHRSGELKRRGDMLWERLAHCELCPRMCGTDIPESNGLMRRGLMIRHLVMPSDVSGTKKVIEWISQNLPRNTCLNLMSQYRPVYKADDHPEISRAITSREYAEAVRFAKDSGLTNFDIQGY